jgi:hypothetical protein
MPRIRYTDWKPRPETQRLIRRANDICGEYAAQGLVLTLRQLYYQFVARGLLPNLQTEYKRLGEILNNARMAGFMDWDYLVDRTRNLAALPHWSSPTEIVNVVAQQYRTDRWVDQPFRVEVWIEKDAGIGVIEAVCQRNQVPYFSCRGYTSVSEIWSAAQRHRAHLEAGQRVVVLHIGDHDPSGLDMSRDIEERVSLFIHKDQQYRIGGRVSERLRAQGHADAAAYYLALSDDKQQALWDGAYADLGPLAGVSWRSAGSRSTTTRSSSTSPRRTPPRRPTRVSAATSARPVWTSRGELDALDPVVLQDLIEDTIGGLRDAERWDAATERMETERRVLQDAAERWAEVTDFLAE